MNNTAAEIRSLDSADTLKRVQNHLSKMLGDCIDDANRAGSSDKDAVRLVVRMATIRDVMKTLSEERF
jgi:hypothetical protein